MAEGSFAATRQMARVRNVDFDGGICDSLESEMSSNGTRGWILLMNIVVSFSLVVLGRS